MVFSVFFIVVLLPAFSARAQAESFQEWLQGVKKEAVQGGISSQLVAKALPEGLMPDERVIRLDHAQPEGGITFQRYKNRIVSPARIRAGRHRILQYKKLLTSVSRTYGVPVQYIAALWGIETSFGRNSGGFETIRSLATLAYEVRRHGFFRTELMDALRIVDQGHIPLREMKGSWAGAMGQCQFMPSSYDKYAQDYNKDGKRDIWHTEADVFASIAAYLSGKGWRGNEPWGVRVYLPKNFDSKMIGMKINKPLEFWRRAGVRIPAVFPASETLSIVQPGGKGYKAYVVGENYRILLNWNNSTYFATAVGLLADRLKS